MSNFWSISQWYHQLVTGLWHTSSGHAFSDFKILEWFCWQCLQAWFSF